MVNKAKDVPAKLYASSYNKGPHDVEIFRIILEKCVEELIEEKTSKIDAGEETEGSGSSSQKKRRKSLKGAISRM